MSSRPRKFHGSVITATEEGPSFAYLCTLHVGDTLSPLTVNKRMDSYDA